MAIIATAGHVDHGKSSLIKAMTGVDPDRLPEEKKRKMTLDLGFAFRDDASGVELQFVDVPGHEDLVKTMIAGCWAATVLLLAVDVHEGLKPQTIEHLTIARLLHVPHLVVALTKCDSEPTHMMQVESQIREMLRDSPWPDARVIRTSALTGAGVEILMEILIALTMNSSDKKEGSSLAASTPRLFVDRVFSRRGTGTVVTGTLTDGTLDTSLQLRIARTGRVVRVREIQHRGRKSSQMNPHSRCALNLTEASVDNIQRGDVLIVDDDWWLCDQFEAKVELAASVMKPLRARGSYMFHLGTAALSCRLVPHGMPEIDRGSVGTATLRLTERIALRPGDRFVIRDLSQRSTVAGGVVTLVDPPMPKWCSKREYERRTHLMASDALESIWVSDGERQTVVHQLEGRIQSETHVEIASLSVPERALLSAIPRLVVRNGRAFLAGKSDAAATALSDSVRSAEFRGPDSATLDRAVARILIDDGILIERGGISFHVDVVFSLRPVVEGLLAENPSGFEVSQLRKRLNLTRRHAVPLAEALDALAITRRVGNQRIAGPALSSPPIKHPDRTDI